MTQNVRCIYLQMETFVRRKCMPELYERSITCTYVKLYKLYVNIEFIFVRFIPANMSVCIKVLIGYNSLIYCWAINR